MSENQQPNPADELQILVGEQQVSLSSNEQVTVHEYTFMEGLKIDAIGAGIIKDLQDLFLSANDGADDIRLQDLSAIFGQDPQAMAELVAIACDRTPEWVQQLSDADGSVLVMTWWQVNKDFFIRRLALEAGVRSIRKTDQSSATPAGDTSSPA